MKKASRLNAILKSSLAFFICVIVVRTELNAQDLEYQYIRVEYITLPANDWTTLNDELQNSWKPLYKEMIENGELDSWKILWPRFPGGTRKPGYSLINITFHSTPNDLANSAISSYYNNTEKAKTLSFTDFEKPILNVINKVKIEVYKVLKREAGDFELDSLAKTNQNFQIDFMLVNNSKEQEYLAMEEDIFRPVHRIGIDDKVLKEWALLEPLYPNPNSESKTYMIINQWATWEKVQTSGTFPNFIRAGVLETQEEFNQLWPRVFKTREMINSELWTLWEEL